MGVWIIEGQRRERSRHHGTASVWSLKFILVYLLFTIFNVIIPEILATRSHCKLCCYRESFLSNHKLNMRQFYHDISYLLSLESWVQEGKDILVRPLTAVSSPTRLTISYIVRNIYETEMPILLPFTDLVRFPRISTSRRKSKDWVFLLPVCQPTAMPSVKVDP